MSEEIQKAQRPEDGGDPGKSPFPLLCLRCGADIDAPDQFFEYGLFAAPRRPPGAFRRPPLDYYKICDNLV